MNGIIYDPILAKLRKEDEQTVEGLSSGEKILAIIGGKLNATLSLAIEIPQSGVYAGKTTLVLYGKSAGQGLGNVEVCRIDASRFVSTEILNDVSIVTNPPGQPEGTYIKFKWNFTPQEPGQNITWLNVSTLIEDLDTTYSMSSPTGASEGNVYIRLTGSDGTSKTIYLKGTAADIQTGKAAITVTTDAYGDIKIDTNATADSALSEAEIEAAIVAAKTLGPLPVTA